MAASKFEPLRPIVRVAKAKPDVRVCMARRNFSDPRMEILLHRRIVDELGVLYRVELGKDAASSHVLRLIADKWGDFTATLMPAGKNPSIYRILKPPVDRFPAAVIPPREVVFERRGSTLVVTLPSWAWDRDRKREAETNAARLAGIKALQQAPKASPPPLAPPPPKSRAEAGRAGAIASNIGRQRARAS